MIAGLVAAPPPPPPPPFSLRLPLPGLVGLRDGYECAVKENFDLWPSWWGWLINIWARKQQQQKHHSAYQMKEGMQHVHLFVCFQGEYSVCLLLLLSRSWQELCQLIVCLFHTVRILTKPVAAVQIMTRTTSANCLFVSHSENTDQACLLLPLSRSPEDPCQLNFLFIGGEYWPSIFTITAAVLVTRITLSA